MEKWALHFLISFLFLAHPGYPQVWEDYRNGARSAALGYSSAALSGNETLFQNQAGIASVKELTVNFSGQSRFLLKELVLYSAGLVLPAPPGSFGGSVSRFGTGEYHQDRSCLTYARKLGRYWSASVTFDYLSQKFPENSHPFVALTCEAGVLFSPGEKWAAGVHVFNPAAVRLPGHAGDIPVPVTVRAGITWNISPFLLSLHELDFSSNRSPSLHSGLEFTPFPEISFRAGVSGGPPEFCFGAGFRHRRMEFDIAFRLHETLGPTPVAGITIRP